MLNREFVTLSLAEPIPIMGKSRPFTAMPGISAMKELNKNKSKR